MPDGKIVAHPARGSLTGNRGILHRPDRTLGVARWQHKAWVCCALAFKDHHRTPMTGRNWTELFFHDEAVALAAGHRPCAYCRRADHLAFRTAFGASNAPEMDAILHKSRVNPRNRQQITHFDDTRALPDGVFFLWQDQPHLRLLGAARPFTASGYGPARPLPTGRVMVMTPAPTVTALRAGYRPAIRL